MFHYTEKSLTDSALQSLPGTYKRALKRFLDFHKEDIKSIKCNMENLSKVGCVIYGGLKFYIDGDGFGPEVSEEDMDILMFDRLCIKDVTSLSGLFTVSYSDCMSLSTFNDLTRDMNSYTVSTLEDILNA